MLRFLNHKVQKITPSHNSFLLIPRTPVVVGALVYKYIIFLRLWYFYFQFFQASPFLPEYNLEKNVTMIKRYLDTHQVITPPFLLPAHVLNTCYRETPDTAPGQLLATIMETILRNIRDFSTIPEAPLEFRLIWTFHLKFYLWLQLFQVSRHLYLHPLC